MTDIGVEALDDGVCNDNPICVLGLADELETRQLARHACASR